MTTSPIKVSVGGWVPRTLTAEQQDFADWAEKRGMRAVFEFYPSEVMVSLSLDEWVGDNLVGRAIDVGDLLLSPDISVREYLETRLRREHQTLKDSL